MKNPYLSIVIPSYDEMANLQKGVLEKVEHFLSRKKYTYEVIVVDDGSKDGSIEFVEKFAKTNTNFKLIKNPHYGKAGAVTKGMMEAKGDHILFTDMDQATPIEEVDKLLPYFDEKYDIVIGSRSGMRIGSPFLRRLISHATIIIRKVLIGMPNLSDTQCGFKMFTKSAAAKIFPRISAIHNGFSRIGGSSVTAGFDVELLFLATQMGYKIKEVPVSWLYVETRRVNPLNDSIQGLKEFVQIRINKLSGKYNAI